MRPNRQLIRSALVVAAFVAGCGGGEPTKPTVTVRSVSVTISTSQLEVAATQTATAEVRDQNNALLTDRAIVWTSSSPGVATVASNGLITAVTPGTATVSATVEGKSGQASVVVVAPKVMSVTLAPPASQVFPGQTVPIVATLKDRNGAILTGRTILWQTSSARIATIDAAGNLKALAGGTITVTATVDDVSAQLDVVVQPPPGTLAPTVTGISPATLTPGAVAIITGTNFGSTADANTVMVAGAVVAINAASPTQLTITVPVTGLPCISTQPVNVDVSTVAGTGTMQQPLTVASVRTLAVGASFMATVGDNAACNELSASGTYVVSVFNATTNLNQTADFVLKGGAPGALASLAAPADVLRSITLAAPAAVRRVPIDPAADAARREHLQHLEADAELFRRLGGARGVRASRAAGGATSSGTRASPVPLTVGDNTTINFNYPLCSTSRSPVVNARVAYVGPKAIVLEDNASPLAGKIDADLIALAQEFETVSFPLLLNFGNPLAWDDSTDHNGRIIMLFTPRVNSLSGGNILGFVQLCDLFDPSAGSDVSASNKAELFYARTVTDTTAASTSLNGRSQWKRQMPATLIHESKHITANAERFADPRPAIDEEVWLEEATAQVASELYGRAIHGNGWRTNSTYTGTLDCEVRPGTAACGAGTFVMGNHFLYLADFLQKIESKTILSGSDDNDIYGSAWMFVRWLTDTYATATEGDFLRSIVKSVTTQGVVNVTTPSGKSWAELLSQFTLMLAADDLANISPPDVEQSWDLPGVYAGYNRDIQNPPPASPLSIRQATFGAAFSATSSLKGGGAMLLRITGTPGAAGTQLLDLHGVSGDALSAASKIGISVLRIQ